MTQGLCADAKFLPKLMKEFGKATVLEVINSKHKCCRCGVPVDFMKDYIDDGGGLCQDCGIQVKIERLRGNHDTAK